MIFEGSRDTEDWSNDALHTNYIQIVKIVYNITVVFTVFLIRFIIYNHACDELFPVALYTEGIQLSWL